MSPQAINKDRVRLRFERSMPTYDGAAVVQRRMARLLTAFLVQARPSRCFGSVLELGCGTGLLTRRLVAAFEMDRWTGNDLVPSAGDALGAVWRDRPGTPNATRFIAGDMEQVELPGGMDLVVSNAAFQWLDDTSAFLKRMAALTAEGGILAFTTFGERNLQEFGELTGRRLSYASADAVAAQLEAFGTVVRRERRTWVLHFETPEAVLRHLKHTGTNALGRGVWTRGDVAAFADAYGRQFGDRQGVRLTYEPLFFVMRKERA